MGALLKYVTIGLLLLSSGAIRAQSPAPMPSEYQVKAAFLYNFLKFVEWPAPQVGPFNVCLIGKDPFGGAVEKAVEGKSIEGRSLSVRYVADLALARTCHVLFISASETKRLTEIVEITRTWGVLTVSDIEGFAGRGGMIGFIVEGQRVRFRINAPAATCAGLKISSKLLQLAAPDGREVAR